MHHFCYDSLYNKSKLYIESAINYRTNGEYQKFGLWASLSLELLGKATLAKINPCLVADPQSPDSLFAACGRITGTTRKTILAKTVFERLKRIIKDFDESAFKFCILMSEYRNTELHSGGVPFDSNFEKWSTKFWKYSKLILMEQEKTLADWIGKQEAGAIDEILNKKRKELNHSIQQRISKCQQAFYDRVPKDEDRDKYKHNFNWNESDFANLLETTFPSSYQLAINKTLCPACNFYGASFGKYWDSEASTQDMEEIAFGTSKFNYSVFAFYCKNCGLKLTNEEEIKISGLSTEFTKIEEVEIDLEDYYMNE